MSFRVGNRTGLAPGKTPLEVELGLEKIIPSEFMLHAHHWLILHGRYTRLARKPRCEVCLINDLCRWPEKSVSLGVRPSMPRKRCNVGALVCDRCRA